MDQTSHLDLSGDECARDLLSSLSDGFIGLAVYRGGRLHYINQTACHILEYSRDELLSYSRDELSRLLCDDDSEIIKSAERLVADRHAHYTRRNVRLTTKDGETKMLTVRLSPLTFAGEPAALVTFIDISDVYDPAPAPRPNTQALHILLDTAVESAVLITTDGTVVAVNENMCRTLHTTREKLTGECIYDCFPVDISERRRRRAEEIIRTKKPVQFEERRDNRYMISSVTPILNDASEVEMLAVFSYDFTELKMVEDALRESEQRFRTVADYTYDWEYWIGPDGKYIYLSPSCERITGYSPDEFTLTPNLLRTITHPDDASCIDDHLSCEMKHDGVLSFDYRITTRGGDVRWIHHVCQPVYAEDGRYLGRRASNRDITAIKSVEQEREELIAELKKTLDHIKTLSGFIPICASCKKIRDDRGYWNQLEEYIHNHSDAQFSHGLCPDCTDKLYGDLYAEEAAADR